MSTDRGRFEDQRAAVLDVLLKGEALTAVEAEEKLSCLHLASRISELRADGWKIHKTMVPLGASKVALYSLPDKERSTIVPVNPEGIPDALKGYPQWVTWRLEVRGGRPTKAPYEPGGRFRASTTDHKTWGSFDDAWEGYESGLVDGIGFVFDDKGIVGIDLDQCIDGDGVLNQKARQIVEALNSYTEVSVSSCGLHVFLLGDIDLPGRRRGPIEIYKAKRYFTVTGKVFEERKEVVENQAALDSLVRSLWPPKAKKAPSRGGGAAYIPNDELLERASAAKNGEKFHKLWSGDCGGYPSQSEADAALVSILWFWCRGSEVRVDELFRRSGLMRPKWEREDYRRRCFDLARRGSEFS